ncbi:MAG TPA: cysteine methyltransferase [Firmicutes bacterium]|jgi:methylated-DNA-[protein]-cysteine S-methyltransferase|nr:cysteine methyltransferase [Bacillota bacterium]
MKLVYDSYQSPLGLIHILMDETAVVGVELTPEGWQRRLAESDPLVRDEICCREAVGQLEEYFHGKRQQFTVPLSIQGPTFSQRVWQELCNIPYGETRSYAEVAQAIDRPTSYRAVGQANRRNPLPIFIPCHRVIGKDGGMTGYIGKGYISIKEQLLALERSYK